MISERWYGSAAEAIEFPRGECHRVSISDIVMSDEDGYALLRNLRRLPSEQNGYVPAIALIAFARSESTPRCHERSPGARSDTRRSRGTDGHGREPRTPDRTISRYFQIPVFACFHFTIRNPSISFAVANFQLLCSAHPASDSEPRLRILHLAFQNSTSERSPCPPISPAQSNRMNLTLRVLLVVLALFAFAPFTQAGAREDQRLETGKITKNEAEHLVLQKFPKATVKNCQLKKESGHSVWQVTFLKPNESASATVEVDGRTGEIVNR